MKFELKQNIFATGIKKVDLSDKEADYIIALASGVDKDEILKCFSLTDNDIEKLYLKFGLKNKKRLRDIQLVTLACMSNFISEYCDKNKNKKFDFPECQELADMFNEIKKSDKEFKEGVMREFEKVIEDHFADKNI